MAVQDLFQETIAKFDLYDDMYFGLVFSDEHKRPLAQLFLRVILGRDDIVVRTVHVEHSLPSLLGRGIRMDVMAIDDRKTTFDIEFQREDAGAGPQRARFNASVIDANRDVKGVDARYLRLPETYVIFITENDVLGGGLPIYHIDRTIAETGLAFNDGSHIIYVNGAHEDTSTHLGRLVHDIRSKRAAEMLTPELAERARDLKETHEGVVRMNTALERLKAEAYAQGMQEGVQQGRTQWMQQGIRQGMLDTLFGLVHDNILTPQSAADRAKLSLDAFSAKMAEYEARP